MPRLLIFLILLCGSTTAATASAMQSTDSASGPGIGFLFSETPRLWLQRPVLTNYQESPDKDDRARIDSYSYAHYQRKEGIGITLLCLGFSLVSWGAVLTSWGAENQNYGGQGAAFVFGIISIQGSLGFLIPGTFMTIKYGRKRRMAEQAGTGH